MCVKYETLTTNVLTPKQVEVFRVEQLEAEESENDLKRERAAVHKVTIEQLNSVVKDYDAPVLDLRLSHVSSLETGVEQRRRHQTETGFQIITHH